MTTKPMIQVHQVSKSYGKVKAIENISLSVHRGEILGIIGSNGSGKTTLLEIIEGLRSADTGEIWIDGMNTKKQHQAIQEIIGVQLQASTLYSHMKVWEALQLFSTYYRRSYNPEDILELIDLQEKRNTYFDNLSTGQKQRVLIGLALINDPKVIFLDEPTNGVDIHTRHKLWNLIRQLKKEKRTIILTTHYLEEVQSICDKIAILHNQHLTEYGTIPELLEKHYISNVIELVLKEPMEDSKPLNELSEYMKNTEPNTKNAIINPSIRHFFISTTQPDALSRWLLEWEKRYGLHFYRFSVKEASLEDLFLKITGKELKE